jgi:hypothetical protein
MAIRVTKVERRVFAVLFAAGEARAEGGTFRLAEGMELPAAVIRRLIRMGLVSVFRTAGGRVHIRPSIGAAGQMAEAREVDTVPRHRAA